LFPLRYQRRMNQATKNDEYEFFKEIEDEFEKGVKNAVFISLGANNSLRVIPLNKDDAIKNAGIISLGKKIFEEDVLENE